MTDHLSRTQGTTTYSGHAIGHDYQVNVRHAPWRTKILALSIDDVEHIPAPVDTDTESAPVDADADADGSDGSDGSDGTDTNAGEEKPVEVDVSGWLAVRITVKRPNDKGELDGKEVIHVSTAALGGAGEVEVRSGLTIAPLLPEPESRSEARDRKRSAKPNTFALIAGLTTAARLIVPLLGLGALFAFITEPIKKWLSRLLSPILDPFFAWLGQLLEPVGRFLMVIVRFIGRVIDFL
ncbi:MAG: hypothetical protein ACTIC1_13050, partial [Brevibacterium sp.]